ncbi:hypothetical protein ANRL4_01519 [Anaerolineae bacterium]|nr:hypothetical protein ANRL4_01519 [Anaerolineae bacterium]
MSPLESPTPENRAAKIVDKPEIPTLDLNTTLHIALNEAHTFNRSIEKAIAGFDLALNQATVRFAGTLQMKTAAAKADILGARNESLKEIERVRERAVQSIRDALNTSRQGYSPSNPKMSFSE